MAQNFEEHKERILIKSWEVKCRSSLKGKTVEEVRYMTKKEAEQMGWFSRPLVIFFNDGSHIFASADDEGNWYSQNVFSPEVGIYEDGEFRGTEPNEEPNSVCIN